MASGPGTYHHKLLRELLLKYLADGNSVESAVVFFRVCERTIRSWKAEKRDGKIEDGRLARKVQS